MNTTPLNAGRYLIQLVVITGGSENRVLTPLTVRPGDEINVTEANLLAAAAYHGGKAEDTTLMHPAFEREAGCLVYPDDDDAAPLPADDMPPLWFAYIDDNNLIAAALSDYRSTIDTYLNMKAQM